MATFDDYFEGAEAATPEPTEVAQPEAVAPDTEVGQGEAEVSTTEPARFDPSEHADKLVTVKVDGEEVQVPLSEALNGYMRQSAFTKRTQEAAEKAKQAEAALAFQEQLRRDPASTIQQLALRALQAQAPKQVEQPPADPVERRMWEYDQRISRFEQWQEQQAQEQADRALLSEVGRLQSEYAQAEVPFDAEKVVQRAAQEAQSTGVAPSLEGVYMRMLGEHLVAQQLAARDLADEQSAADAAVTAAKVAAGQLQGGASAMGGGADLDDSNLDTAEAFKRAVEMHGGLRFG